MVRCTVIHSLAKLYSALNTISAAHINIVINNSIFSVYFALVTQMQAMQAQHEKS